MRNLACSGEVSIHYDVPLTAETQFSERYVDPQMVAAVGMYISLARKAMTSKYPDVVRINAQLDPNYGYNGLDERVVEGYNFSINFSRTDKTRVSMEMLETVVFGFMKMVPLQQKSGGAPIGLHDKIKAYTPRVAI